MAIGPFARVVAQVFVVGGSVLFKAFSKAYKDQAKNRKFLQLKKKMTKEEAEKILQLDEINFQELEKRTKILLKLNEKNENFLGSPFLQEKIRIANFILSKSMQEKQENQQQKENVNSKII